MTAKRKLCYLEAWADKSGKLAVLREGCSPSYRMVQSLEEFELKNEKLMCFMEVVADNFFPILDSLRANPQLGQIDNPHHLLVYLAVQRYRASFLRATSPKEAADLLKKAFDFLMSIVQNLNAYTGRVIELGDESEFITSDNPVIDYSPKITDVPLLPELFFPITPKTGLFFHKYAFEIDQRVIPDWVNAINDKIFKNSYDEIFATNTTMLERYIRPIAT